MRTEPAGNGATRQLVVDLAQSRGVGPWAVAGRTHAARADGPDWCVDAHSSAQKATLKMAVAAMLTSAAGIMNFQARRCN